MHTIIHVVEEQDIVRVAELAHKIWHRHYTPIIGQDQVNYMLEKFQSYTAISAQLRSGYLYYLLTYKNSPVGYIALLPDKTGNSMLISKLYVLHDQRGLGHGNCLLTLAKNESLKQNIKKIWLTVNKHNTESINWYKRKGLVITKEVKNDIGNGFYMDDYMMELEIDTPSKRIKKDRK